MSVGEVEIIRSSETVGKAWGANVKLSNIVIYLIYRRVDINNSAL
jgi:hypothetical protein